MNDSEHLRGARLAGLSGLAVPLQGLVEIGRLAASIERHEGKLAHGIGVATFGRLLEQAMRLFPTQSHAFAALIQCAELRQRLQVIFLRRATVPAGGLGGIARNALGVQVDIPQAALSDGAALISEQLVAGSGVAVTAFRVELFCFCLAFLDGGELRRIGGFRSLAHLRAGLLANFDQEFLSWFGKTGLGALASEIILKRDARLDIMLGLGQCPPVMVGKGIGQRRAGHQRGLEGRNRSTPVAVLDLAHGLLEVALGVCARRCSECAGNH